MQNQAGFCFIIRIFFLSALDNQIRIRLVQESEEVEDRPNQEKTRRAEIQDARANLPFVELVGAEESQEQTKSQSYPFVLHASAGDTGIDIGVRVGVGIVDDDVRRGRS